MSVAVAVKVSAELAASARTEANATDRSLTGQIEHWAKLGRATEAIMPSQVAAALKRCGGDLSVLEDETMRAMVLDALAVFQSKSPASVRQMIGLDRETRFEPDKDNLGGMIRIDPEGTKTRGWMEGRTFVPVS